MTHKNIAVSGGICTGSTTLAKGLADRLGWGYLGAGVFFRKWHMERGIPLVDTLMVPEEVDREIDFGFLDRMKVEVGMVFESHLAGFLARDLAGTFKILTICNFDVAIKRLCERDDLEYIKALEDYRARSGALAKKFKKLYGVKNCYDKKYFDFVVDTSNLSKQETLEKVFSEVSLKQFDLN